MAALIGYYVHHVGAGHLARARAICEALVEEVTVLSSLRAPPDWDVGWVQLARDDAAPTDEVTAGGRLHWAPRGNGGLVDRMASIATWLAQARPSVLVVDVSVEVTVLARTCGVPVIAVALPGSRTDHAHQLGFALADIVLAPWPDLEPALCDGLAAHRDRVVHVGGISRFDSRMVARRRGEDDTRRALVLHGRGGPGPSVGLEVPGWQIDRVGPQRWTADPWDALCAADVVVSHCGLGAVADIAAARRPAVLVAHPRPHDEQVHTGRALERLECAVVPSQDIDVGQWLDEALWLDPAGWRRWSDGHGAERAAAVIADVASGR